MVSALHAWPLAPILRTLTGGSPSTLGASRKRYEQQATTWSVDRHERWLNWIVREVGGREPIGYVQAGITVDGDTLVGRLAWVIGTRHQRRGYAREAAGAMAMWLREQGARTLVADIHPDHQASMIVARSLGLKAGHHVLESGEIRWTG